MKKIVAAIPFLLFSACSTTQEPAPYVDHSGSIFNRSSDSYKKSYLYRPRDNTSSSDNVLDIETKADDIVEEQYLGSIETNDQENINNQISTNNQTSTNDKALFTNENSDIHDSGRLTDRVAKTSQGSNYKLKTPLNLNNFEWPVEGRVIKRFGKQDNKFNEGINIVGSLGLPVSSTADGKVIYVGKNVEGYGNMLIIKHEKDIMSAYAHLNDIVIDRGDYVRKGDTIGSVGSTGNVKEPQLHFSLRIGKKTIDPEEALPE